MTIQIYKDLLQGSDEWLQTRCGILTASEMKLIVTPTFKAANNDKTRAHIYEMAAQRISKYVEPTYINDDMVRGSVDEIQARILYEKHYAPVDDIGFMTNDKWGFTLGYSPDGLVGDKGLIECKSRKQYLQVKTIIENACPDEHYIQCQTGLLVSERDWIDYISYCGGMPLAVYRVYPDAEAQEAILIAASEAEKKIADVINEFTDLTKHFIMTERIIEEEINVD